VIINARSEHLEWNRVVVCLCRAPCKPFFVMSAYVVHFLLSLASALAILLIPSVVSFLRSVFESFRPDRL